MKIRIISVITLLLTITVLIIGNLENKKTEIKEVKIIKEDITYEKEIIEQINPIELCISNMQLEISAINHINDKETWFREYKKVVEKYSDIIAPPKTIYDYFSDEELDLLFRVVQAEIGDEYTFEQKVNVANVIFNRLYSNKDDFAKQDTLSKVLVKKQFSTIKNERYKKVEVSDITILACEYAFEIEDTTNGALFFDNNGILGNYYKEVFYDGAHYFYK